MRFYSLDTIHHTAYNKLDSKLPDTLHCILPSTLLIALNSRSQPAQLYPSKLPVTNLPRQLPSTLTNTLPIALADTSQRA